MMTVGTMMELTEVFSVDPTQLNESGDTWAKELPDGRWKVRAMGQHCYLGENRGLVKNRNGRRYPANTTWARHTQQESAFLRRVMSRRVTGQVEHPETGRSSMGAAAVVITKVEPPRTSDGKVFIEYETMHTPGGKIIEGFHRSNVGYGLSSRGNGSVVNVDGVDEVQEDFEPVTFDCVHDESTPGAEVAAKAMRESLDALVESAGSLEEAIRRDRAATMEELLRIEAAASPPEYDGGEWCGSTQDGEGHYRMFELSPANFEVWLFGHNVEPVLVASDLRTRTDATKAAENHLHIVVGESYQVQDAKSFEGTSLRIRLDSADEAKKAFKALEKAGFYVAQGDDEQGFEVCTKYACPEAALDHVGKVLREAGIDMAVSEDVSEQSHFMFEPEADLVDTSSANYMGGGPRLPRGGGTMPGMNYMGGMDYEGGVMAPEDDEYEPDMDYMGGEDDDEDDEYEPDMDYMGGEDDDEDDEYDMDGDPEDYRGGRRGRNYRGGRNYQGGCFEQEMVGDPDTMPDDLEAADDISDEYGGTDPEDLDLDLDVNEADYETGQQRKNTGIKGGGASAAVGDATAPTRSKSDVVKKGGSADTSGGQGEIRPDQRKAQEGGSELPAKGRGTSEPQKAAKMAEAVMMRALPDLAEAWRRGDARRATKILQFIEHATSSARAQLIKPQRTRFLQNEVARLEDENIRLRALTEAMAEVQRTEVLMYERKLMLRDHPELGPMEERLERCDTVQEMQDEVQALLAVIGTKGAQTPKVEGVGSESANLTEGAAARGEPSSTFVLRRGGEANSLSSSAQPLSEATVVQTPDLSVPQERGGDTATRLADYRRRRRGGGN